MPIWEETRREAEVTVNLMVGSTRIPTVNLSVVNSTRAVTVVYLSGDVSVSLKIEDRDNWSAYLVRGTRPMSDACGVHDQGGPSTARSPGPTTTTPR